MNSVATCDAGGTREGASINAAAMASAINYKTAQRIVRARAERRQELAATPSELDAQEGGDPS